ncbi:hypothetical protein EBB07_05490 [Paenibacillaceae bacterium]|nr:hypothetical protein EBB07_05490 [Paenibacillaceae bacterium]
MRTTTGKRKKVTTLLTAVMSLSLVFALAACGDSVDNTGTGGTNNAITNDGVGTPDPGTGTDAPLGDAPVAP